MKRAKQSMIPSFVGLLPQVPFDNDSSSSHIHHEQHHNQPLPVHEDEDDSMRLEVIPPAKKKLRFLLPHEEQGKNYYKSVEDDETFESSVSSDSDSDAWWYPEEQPQLQQQDEPVEVALPSYPFIEDVEDEAESPEDDESRWYNKSDIVEFHSQAKEQVNRFRRKNQGWIRRFIDDICLDPSSSTTKPLNLKQLLKTYQPPKDYNSVRGLHIDTCLVAHRRLHCQRVLLIQEKLKQSKNQQASQDQREFILKSTSLQTSKSSKTLARWFAHYDYMDMISSIKQELST